MIHMDSLILAVKSKRFWRYMEHPHQWLLNCPKSPSPGNLEKNILLALLINQPLSFSGPQWPSHDSRLSFCSPMRSKRCRACLMRTKLRRLRVGEERPGRTGNLWVFPSWLRVSHQPMAGMVYLSSSATPKPWVQSPNMLWIQQKTSQTWTHQWWIVNKALLVDGWEAHDKLLFVIGQVSFWAGWIPNANIIQCDV
jgi:hypothetical protein